jgi:hypothetical protein
MKRFIKIIIPFMVTAVIFFSCQKEPPLPFYSNGMAPVFSSSATTIAPGPADSNSVAVVFSWTNPHYATDSNTVKYMIQIDSSGGKFDRPDTITIMGRRNDTIIAKDLNALLVSWGYSFGVSYNVPVRLVSSYANNNEQYISNVITLKVTPYVVPPKVAPPASGELFLVGDATVGGWNNPVPVPTQQFEQIDSVTYGGVFELSKGKQYLMLPVNGDWSQKYAVSDNSVSGLSAGGSFSYYKSGGQNFPAPDSTGLYKIMVDFQHGTFTVTPYKQVLPDSLFITGDAFSDAWANPVPATQMLTRINSCQFELTTPLLGGKQYLLLPVNGSWSNKFSVQDNSVAGLSAGGAFGYNLPANFPGPAAGGTYKILVNFLNYTFSVMAQ